MHLGSYNYSSWWLKSKTVTKLMLKHLVWRYHTTYTVIASGMRTGFHTHGKGKISWVWLGLHSNCECLKQLNRNPHSILLFNEDPYMNKFHNKTIHILEFTILAVLRKCCLTCWVSPALFLWAWLLWCNSIPLQQISKCRFCSKVDRTNCLTWHLRWRYTI